LSAGRKSSKVTDPVISFKDETEARVARVVGLVGEMYVRVHLALPMVLMSPRRQARDKSSWLRSASVKVWASHVRSACSTQSMAQQVEHTLMQQRQQ
jgi:hypothetical protein